jgi:hypothetical protein
MSKKVESGEKPVEKEAAREGVDVFIANNGENWKAVMKAGEVMLEGMTVLGREMMDFGNARFRHDVETSESLINCKGADDAFRLQCDFMREATQQYFEEAGKLTQLTARLTRDCWAPLEDRTRVALRQMNGD